MEREAVSRFASSGYLANRDGVCGEREATSKACQPTLSCAHAHDYRASPHSHNVTHHNAQIMNVCTTHRRKPGGDIMSVLVAMSELH
jgi:hypothetical protein